MAFLSLFFFCAIPMVFIGEVDGTIILNATAAAELQFFQGNKELLNYAALSGEVVYFSVELYQQTLIAQHNANVTLDCLSLFEKKHTGQNISWSVLFEGEKEFKEIPNRIEKISGIRSSQLKFISNRFKSAGFVTGNSGTYRCGICEKKNGGVDRCKYHNTTVFVIGGAPILDISHKEPESYMPGYDYKIGSKFCLEKSKRACRIILLCTLYNKDVAIPIQGLQWQLNGQTLFSDPSGMINTDFLMSGNNMLLSPGLINPTPVRANLDFIEINLCFHNVTMMELLPDGINAHNVEDKLFDLILGQWTCQQNNSFGDASATTYISECGILPGFRENRRVVNESDGTFIVCVPSPVEYSFNIYSANGAAKESLDYLKVNSSWRDGDNSSCFEITIIDDDIEEIPEVFQLHLDVYKDGKSVRADNHTLTVIILDNDRSSESSSTCTLKDYVLVNEVDDNRKETVGRTLEVLPSNVFSNVSILTSTSLEETYQQISQSLGHTPSSEKQATFANAIDNIQESYSDCRSSGETFNTSTLSRLFDDFQRATRAARKNATKAQVIFGKFLCFDGPGKSTEKRRIKRQFMTPTQCSCPDSEDVESACQFFACLDVKAVEVLLGFGNADSDEPCIAFIIDTTGSMANEIVATRRVILQFLKAQADSTICYMLVPFNDYGISSPNNVGPIQLTFTDDESIEDLQRFEEAVNGLSANGGGDHAEYCLSAILEALKYSLVDAYGYTFIPMNYYSHMVVITDATSKLEELKDEVIRLAVLQEVTISFIVSHDGLLSYEPYTAIAEATRGIIHQSELSSTTWALAEFARTWSDRTTGGGRRKRAVVIPRRKEVAVSVFATNLRVSVFCPRSTGNIRITLPNKTEQSRALVDFVMIYLASSPLPGMYIFDYGSLSCETHVDIDYFFNTRVLFFNSNTTLSSSSPPLACTSGKVAITSIQHSSISSIVLKETDSKGNVQDISLTKCTNAFISDVHKFGSGKAKFQMIVRDIEGSEFTYNNIISYTFQNMPSSYSLKANVTALTIDYTERFFIAYEISSRAVLGTSNFTFSVDSVTGFQSSIYPSSVILQPQERRTVIMTSQVKSRTVPAGRPHPFVISADNGCVKMSARAMITLNPLPTIPPRVETANPCGCQNGGTCTIIRRGRRVSKRCQCPPGYGGSKCQRST